eukprot:g5637.t1
MAVKGSATISMIWRVPQSEEAAVSAMWLDHQQFMRTTHSLGDDGQQKPRLREFWIAKGEELQDPMNPESEKTGNVLFLMHEIYVDAAEIPIHMDKYGAWQGADGKSEAGAKMKELLEKGEKYGVHMAVGNTSVFTTLEDKQNPLTARAGDPCIHMVWKVPKSEEAAVDALWKDHEKFMRKTHKYTLDGDDKEVVRLTSFSISKGNELKDPMDPSKGETGMVLYQMAESYVAHTGIQSHLSKFGEWQGADNDSEAGVKMKNLLDMDQKYGVFREVGATKVFTCFK